MGYTYPMTSDPPKRRPGRPATGKTPSRHVRVGPAWDQAKAIAKQHGETISAVVNRALNDYIRNNTK